MFVANIEYDRLVRWTRYTGGPIEWTNLYTDDLSNSFLTLTLQDSSSKDIYEGKNFKVNINLIEGPVGSVSFPTGGEHKAIMEFIVPRPDFEIPEGSNYFVEWEDPDWGAADWYEFNISENTGDEPIEWVVPFK